MYGSTIQNLTKLLHLRHISKHQTNLLQWPLRLSYTGNININSHCHHLSLHCSTSHSILQQRLLVNKSMSTKYNWKLWNWGVTIQKYFKTENISFNTNKNHKRNHKDSCCLKNNIVWTNLIMCFLKTRVREKRKNHSENFPISEIYSLKRMKFRPYNSKCIPSPHIKKRKIDPLLSIYSYSTPLLELNYKGIC